LALKITLKLTRSIYKIIDMTKIPKVILLIDTSRAYGRGLLRGIAKYSNLHGPWIFNWRPPFYRETGREEIALSQLKDWSGDGIIIREQKKTIEIISMGLPTIVAPWREPFPGVANIITDSVAIGRMAAEHLLHRGFRHFGYCGFGDMFYWSRERSEGFSKRIAEAGFKTHFYQQPKSRAQRLWEKEQILLADWLKSLPKPIGLMACTDDRSRDVMEACKIAGLNVPVEIAIVGADNDEIICNLSDIPLSSVAFNVEKAGYEAAELLDELMAGKKMADQRILVRPTHVVARQSTDILAISDKEVAEAVRFIRRHSREPIQVRDVVDAIALSRRSLYQRFHRVLGRSPNEEIRRTRVEQITRMLVETDLSVKKIALALGFSDAAHIARYFRQEKGLSLIEYRKQYGRK